MAEQSSDVKHQQPANKETEDRPVTTTGHDSTGDGAKPEKATGVNLVQPEAEEKMAQLTERSPSLDNEKMLTQEESSTLTQADDGDHGEFGRQHSNIKAKEIDASSPGCNNSETTNETNEDIRLADVESEEKMAHLTETSASLDNEKMLNQEESSTLTQADDGDHGDFGRQHSNIKAKEIDAEKHFTGGTAAQEITTLQGDRGYDQVDRLEERPCDILRDITNTSAEEKEVLRSPEKKLAKGAKEGDDEAEEQDEDENTTSSSAILQPKSSVEQQRSDVETILPTTEEHVEIPGGNKKYLMAVVVVVFAILIPYCLPYWETPPQKNDEQQIDIFLRHMEELMSRFPDQRFELWKRSRIHLLRHLQTAQPTEPVSLILTAGLRGERTLHCLARGMATAFSSALNASVLHIDGASKASQDSDQVKLDIDRNLQVAFEGDKPVAVIHRFEELPPSSTLIFYRYCDHENAAYKKTFLIFTVLLGEEEEIPATSRLSAVEEMVDDHLQKKFLSDNYPVSYDRMDLDKYGGLWSRISHLILPVAAVERIEQKGC